MKLLRQIIPENPFISEEVSGIFNYITSETDQSGYEDITSIENWDKFKKHIKKDYKFIRTRIKELYLAKGWQNLSYEEMKVICKYMASGIGAEYHNSETIWTNIEQYQFQRDFVEGMRLSRTLRDQAVTDYMMYMIFMGEATQGSMEDMIHEITALRTLYLRDGMEGTQWGDTYSGLMDYLVNSSIFSPISILEIDLINNIFIVGNGSNEYITDYIRVRNSTNNDGKYTIISKEVVDNNLKINVFEPIQSNLIDGVIYHSGFKRRSCYTLEREQKLIDIYINGNY